MFRTTNILLVGWPNRSLFHNLGVNIMAKKSKVVPSVVSNLADIIAEVNNGVVVEPVVEVVVEPVVEVKSDLTEQLEAIVSNPVPAVKQDKNEGVGIFIKKLIVQGKGNKEILALVHEAFGNKNTTYACVAWYRNKMKKTGAVKKSSPAEIIELFLSRNEELVPSEEVEALRENLSRMAG
jgi:hypothetical protein